MDIDRLLKAIGKTIFIEYYEDFKNECIDNLDMIDRLPREYTLNSRRSRTYKSRKIFSEGLNVEALENIMASDKLEPGVIDKARRLYIMETEPKHKK